MSSAIPLDSPPLPLRMDEDGACRVGTTRVTLDVVVDAFDEGATAEEIAHQYPTLQLGDVYAVLAHVIRHRAEVDGYLRDRSLSASTVRAENEQRFPNRGLRARLAARAVRARP